MTTNMRTWNCDDCTVTERENDYDLRCFEVRMERDGQIRTQTMYPQTITDMEACIADLDDGMSPVGAWEDGVGNLICWENAEDEEVLEEDVPEEPEQTEDDIAWEHRGAVEDAGSRIETITGRINMALNGILDFGFENAWRDVDSVRQYLDDIRAELDDVIVPNLKALQDME